MTDIGSGYSYAGRITTGHDGGNHPLRGDVLRCRSCGTLLRPDDQDLHEGFHALMDRALRVAMEQETM